MSFAGTIRENREQGFTLIELLVVILIIGVLTAIAIPMFLNQRKAANDAVVEADMKNAAIAVETWMSKNPHSVTPPSKVVTGPGVKTYGDIEVTVSPGVSMELVNYGRNSSPESGAFVIYGWHENGDKYVDCSRLRYSSIEGGFKAWKANGATC